MSSYEIAHEALSRARGNVSVSNYPAIFDGFLAKGIAEADIEPRENVLTYHAWRAIGRQVRRGEHGVRVTTWITCTKRTVVDDGEAETYRRPKTASVFHISQTDEVL